jgi:adenylate cyclase
MLRERPVRVERRLSAILVADVAGYSRLMHNDEEGTHAKLTGLLADAVAPAINEHGGRIVKNTGDGFLAEFPSAVEAVRAAMQFQARIKELTIGEVEDGRIAFRVGVNISDAIIEAHDIFGDGVNIAARLEALAQPGTVCISHTVYEQVRSKLDLDCHPLGSHRVKNIAEPIRAYAVGISSIPGQVKNQRRLLTAAAGACGLAAAGLVAWTLHTGAGRGLLGWAAPKPVEVADLPAPHRLAGRPSVAVLPFKNLSTDAGQDFFSGGITEDIITALGRFSNLLVVAKSASSQLKDQTLSPTEIGRLLDVRYLLVGSVRRAGDRLRVNAELTEAATGRNVWSEAYDAEVKDIFDVQQDIARRVVGAAAVKLTRFERDRALAKPTESLAAYEYVLRGREHLSRASRDSNDEAQDMFQRAIDVDPSYAEAHAELGLTLCEAVASGWTEFIADDLARAETLAQKALLLDSASTTAYRLLAEVHLARRNFDLALGQIDRALKINPSDAESFSMRGSILVWAGSAAEALPWLEGALRLDNANARATFLLGTAYYFLDRYSASIEAMDHALAGSLGLNTQVSGRSILAAAYAQLDRRSEAERERNAAMRIAPLLNAERFASQFGTQTAHDHMLEGLKKAGFH